MFGTGRDSNPAFSRSESGFGGRDLYQLSLHREGRGALTVGSISPPSLGVLGADTGGRGALATFTAPALGGSIFSSKETYGDFARRALGLHLQAPDDRWEVGVLDQTNDPGDSAEIARRFGLVGSYRHVIGRLKLRPELALVVPDWSDQTRLGGGLETDYTIGAWVARGQTQAVQRGFLPDGQYSLRDSIDLSYHTATWRWVALASRYKQEGALLRFEQEAIDTGQAPLDPNVSEIVNQSALLDRRWSTRIERYVQTRRYGLEIQSTDRKSEARSGQRSRDLAITADYSRGLPGGAIRPSLTFGREQESDQWGNFMELAAEWTREWTPNLSWSIRGRQTWNFERESAGYRRSGLVADGSLQWRRGERFRIGLGGNLYQLAGTERAGRAYAHVETATFAGGPRVGLEVVSERRGRNTGVWTYVRWPLRVGVPWRPVMGAVAGRVADRASGAGVAGVMFEVDGDRTLSEADGQFVSAAKPTGRYELGWTLPPGWASDESWPREIQLEAGRITQLTLLANRLKLVRGFVTINRPLTGEPLRPSGIAVAIHEDGRFYEALVAGGTFALTLPSGVYRFAFDGDFPESVLTELQAQVEIKAEDPDPSVLLSANEQTRPLRRTLSPNPD